MFGATHPQDDIDTLMRKVELGNASDSVSRYLNDYIENAVQKFMAQWVNYDLTQIRSDAGVISFHESYRQAIRTHLLLKTRLNMSKLEGRQAEELVGLKGKTDFK